MIIPRFVWTDGRQESGYRKMLISQGKTWDCWLIHYPAGSDIPEHTDPARNDENHYRCNIVLTDPGGGIFHGKTFFNLFGRVIFFRPDIWPHYITKVENGSRYVLSFGWVTEKGKVGSRKKEKQMRKIAGWRGSITVTLWDDQLDSEFDVKAEVSISDYFPAKTSGLPDDCYPAEGGEVEVLKVMYKNKDILKELSAAQIKEIEDAALEENPLDHHEEPDYDDYDDGYDYDDYDDGCDYYQYDDGYDE